MEIGTGRPRPAVSRHVLGVILGLSFALHLAFILLDQIWFSSWRYPHIPVHAVVEAAGAFIALALAPMLLRLEARGAGTSRNVGIALALVAMGIFDGAHALSLPGNTFVFLHSLASAAGGLAFAGLWFELRDRRWVLLAAVAALAVSVWAIGWPGQVPRMVERERFTLLAVTLNGGGGLGFLVGAVRLVRAYRAASREDDALFVLHCVLFGAAALMFEASSLWDLSWWGWHVLRLLAYAVALAYVVAAVQIDAVLADLSTRLRAEVEARRETEAALRSNAEELARSNAELEQFAFVTAHDLREPLRMVSSFTELMEVELAGKLDAETASHMAFVREGASRMDALVRDLLKYARVDRPSDEAGEIAGDAALDLVLRDLRTLIEGRRATLTRAPLPTLPLCPTHARQVLQNLIANALLHAGDEPAEVHVSGAAHDSRVEVRVADRGRGIAPEHRERIFGLFQRLEPRRPGSGTGLGLAICRKIVEAAGGRIHVEDNPGGGAVFVVTLPSSSA